MGGFSETSRSDRVNLGFKIPLEAPSSWATFLEAGGDERLFGDFVTRRNRYHLETGFVRKRFLNRGSCTANPLSIANCRRILAFLEGLNRYTYDELVGRDIERVKKLFPALEEGSYEVFFGPSGTDLLYFPLAFLSAGAGSKEVDLYLSCADELGSGSSLAVQGIFFLIILKWAILA